MFNLHLVILWVCDANADLTALFKLLQAILIFLVPLKLPVTFEDISQDPLP